MGDHIQRHRTGPLSPIRVPVGSSTVVKIGDMLYWDDSADEAKPAEDLSWNSDLETTQGDFQEAFLGVALHGSEAGEDRDILVAREGIFEFECAEAEFDLGAPVAPAEATGDELENQKVVEVDPHLRIGLAVRHYDANTETVLCELLSVYKMAPAGACSSACETAEQT